SLLRQLSSSGFCHEQGSGGTVSAIACLLRSIIGGPISTISVWLRPHLLQGSIDRQRILRTTGRAPGAVEGLIDKLGAPCDPIAREVKDQVVMPRLGRILEKMLADECRALSIDGFELTPGLCTRNAQAFAYVGNANRQGRDEPNAHRGLEWKYECRAPA